MHRALAGCCRKHQCERGNGKNCGKIVSLPSAPAPVDQLWCWWTFFLLQGVQASLHLTPHPKLRGVLCPVCGTAAQHHHAIISWRETWKLCLMPFNHSLFLQACHVPSVVFQLHSPSSSSHTPARLALKRPVLFCTHVSQVLSIMLSGYFNLVLDSLQTHFRYFWMTEVNNNTMSFQEKQAHLI